jgi:hypothetical protein
MPKKVHLKSPQYRAAPIDAKAERRSGKRFLTPLLLDWIDCVGAALAVRRTLSRE